jgi:hypothetical protein
MIDTYLGNSNAVAAKIRKKPEEAVVVRGAASVGGSQVFIGVTSDDKARLLKTLDQMTGDSLLLLQPYLSHESSPNLQFYITDHQIHLLGRTVQMFDKRLGHCGNYFDSVSDDDINATLTEQGQAIITQAAALGYRGVAGVDFIVTGDGGAYPVELNARHNTSTHALWFLNRFFGGDPFGMIESGRGAFVRLKTGKKLPANRWLEMLGDSAFDPDRGRGILPYDIDDGFSFLVAGGDKEDRARLIAMAQKIA